MSRFFRSVGARLSLALLLVVAAALGIVYLAVVPSLQTRLENTRLTQLAGAAHAPRPRGDGATNVCRMETSSRPQRTTSARA